MTAHDTARVLAVSHAFRLAAPIAGNHGAVVVRSVDDEGTRRARHFTSPSLAAYAFVDATAQGHAATFTRPHLTGDAARRRAQAIAGRYAEAV